MTGLYVPSTEHDACGVGFVADIKGRKSRQIVEQGIEVLRRLAHRAATGADPETGDGAGVMLQLPYPLFEREAERLRIDDGGRRHFAIGQVFLPPDPAARKACEQTLTEVVEEEGQWVAGWRDVPVDPAQAGPTARRVMPVMRQIYVRLRRLPPSSFERRLYIIRKVTENRVRARKLDPDGFFHIASLSTERIVYKGLLLPAQLERFYPDLQSPEMVSAIALVHSRFSTNTFPTWDLAQPFHYIAHNGEINTRQGNRNWNMARRGQLESAKFGGKLDRLFPIIVPDKSDSAQFDNMLELLHLGGRGLAHSMMMMIPEAWQGDSQMDEQRRDFYRYASCLVEPWDGPAAIAFTDGSVVGATLDRNGLRPARYLVTEDDRVILASEAGVIDVPPGQVRSKGRLRPGLMFLVDTVEGRIIDDAEIKREIAGRFRYGSWLKRNVFAVDQLPTLRAPAGPTAEALRLQQLAFGYTDEQVSTVLAPMAAEGKEPLGSMGNDIPLAVLSDSAPALSCYFHQLFAQVTNPPIDPIREALVMSLRTNLGPVGNTFEETPEQCHHLRLSEPILYNSTLAKLGAIREGVFESITLSLLYDVADGAAGLQAALDRLLDEAVDAVDDHHNVLILSDRGVDAERVAIPSLLAVSAVHQHLVREGIRMQAGIVVETAEARTVHDVATLIGYGAGAVNPYLAIDTVEALAERQVIEGTPDVAMRRYVDAIDQGLLKVMSKMGISTVQSYRGAQIFEAVGLHPDLIERYFTGTPSRLGGLTLEDVGREVLERHGRAYGREAFALDGELPLGGTMQWRRRGERHKWTPATIARLQAATRNEDRELFADYCRILDDERDGPITIRGMLELDEQGAAAVPLEEVEPASAIVKRFVTGAMSFGSISAEAHETLAVAMNRLGGRSNSGEGGEEPHRFVPDENGDLRRSAIKQVASGRFGVTTHYLVNADDLQIKVAQGAKPGEGGQLPGHKIDERIARVRCSVPGVTLISPPPHHDIYSIEDLAQLIYDLQAVNPGARVSVKLVSEVGIGTVAAGVAKAHAGAVVVAGYAGGTGAAPVSSIQHAGLPWELGLAETQQVLVLNGLRSRIRLQVDGGLRTARDVVVAALLGAEEYGVATAALIVSGCVMLRKCHLNTCATGVATQDPELRKRYSGRAEDVVSFFTLMAEEVRRYMARLGFRTVDEMVGQVGRLRVREDRAHWKARTLDLRAVLAAPRTDLYPELRCVRPQPWPLDNHIDQRMLPLAEPAIQRGEPVEMALPITNRDRAAGTMLSGVLTRVRGAEGLPRGTICARMTGVAGQSFGAFLARGITLELEGEANDYVGKGLSGGRIVVFPSNESRFRWEENVIVGNTVLYGATSGDAFIAGMAGERFAVRNSGARAVVEGVGDHGCEYMTGGVVVVLGSTGRNFAAGMTGGMAFVFDRGGGFHRRCNTGSVELRTLLDESEIWLVRGLLEDHVQCTGSPHGARILDNWDLMHSSFVVVMPTEYKRTRRRSPRPRQRTSAEA